MLRSFERVRQRRKKGGGEGNPSLEAERNEDVWSQTNSVVTAYFFLERI